jgi:hypothetical protein
VGDEVAKWKGIRLEQQSEDGQGSSAFLPLYTNAPLAGNCNIPADLIYHELLRKEIEYGVSLM